MPEVEDNKKNVEICRDFCGSCPSYPGTKEWLFCSRGRSRRKIEKGGCLCPSCQVYMDCDLSSQYFCTEGIPK
ncbi:DUF2769 domain-containing protein [Candidatus Bathyarchaeota archaeon]|nr:DUF2769 domain-containing protein [Candidatus Bathyarchaeota archaeon]